MVITLNTALTPAFDINNDTYLTMIFNPFQVTGLILCPIKTFEKL